MNSVAGHCERLTWDPVHPAPFESIWSIFHKVIAFNHISLNELRKLIQKREMTYYSWSDTDWIDFERFGSLLRIDPKRLMSGTWRAMGMKPSPNYDYCFRQCPQCWARGYHCVLFDLAWIEQCPWHRCNLTKGCRGCGSIMSFSRRTNYDTHVILKRFCTICRNVFPEYRELLQRKPFEQNETLMIIGYCVELFEWWRTLGERFSDRDKLLNNLLWVSKIDDRTNVEALVWQFSYARQLTSDIDLFWKFAFIPVPVPVRLAVINCNTNKATDPFSKQELSIWKIRDEAGKQYRSLRRHLYKKFVRGHCRCGTELRGLSRQQAMALNGANVCTVALAYLVWRMSIEGICHLDEFRFPRKDNFELKLMGSDNLNFLSLPERLRWTYFAFFGLLNELRSVNGPYNVRVVTSTSIFDGGLQWCFGESGPSITGETAAVKGKRLLVLYPDVANRMTELLRQCQERWKQKRELVDEEQVYNDSHWARYIPETSEQKFRVVVTRHSDLLGARTFSYIQV